MTKLTPAQRATLRKLKQRFAVWEHPLEVIEPIKPTRKQKLQAKIGGVKVFPNKKLGLKCPSCKDGDQIYRKNRSTGELFIACTGFPSCRWSANLPDSKRYNESQTS